VHDPPPENDPPMLLAKWTVPLGAVALPVEVSEVVAVHVVVPPVVSAAGEHETVVAVDRVDTDQVKPALREAPVVSETVTVTANAPAAAAAPEISPLAGSMVKPGGRPAAA
jgi:hypothetical protein